MWLWVSKFAFESTFHYFIWPFICLCTWVNWNVILVSEIVNKNTPHVQPTQEDSSFKRKLSKREKKELKKQEKKEKVNHIIVWVKLQNINVSHDYRLMGKQGRVGKGKRGMGWPTNFTQVRQPPPSSSVEILWRGRYILQKKRSQPHFLFGLDFFHLQSHWVRWGPLNRCSGPHWVVPLKVAP